MYGDKISIEQGGTKPGKIIFNSKMRLEDALLKENGIKRRLEIQLRDAALALRADKVSWGGGDIIYAVSSGANIPTKHLEVGLAMKSLTGSRKVIKVLNQLQCGGIN